GIFYARDRIEPCHHVLGAGTGIENTGATEKNGADWAAAIKESNNQHPDHDTASWAVRGRDG
ncbi:hypothetical protein ACCS92_38315, partial [Rhizobium ruizarguesonis]